MPVVETSFELDTLPTPTLVIWGEQVRRNVQKLADYGKSVDVKIRPHTKTHKLRFLAQMQLDAGAVGLTVAKVSEAEAITDPGQDVLVAYPPVGVQRAERLAALARDRTVRAGIDSLTAVEAASAAARAAGTMVGLLVDLDIGLHRTGVPTPAATLPLAQAIDRAPNLRLDGLMIYPGQVSAPPESQAAEMRAIDALVLETIDLWSKHGLQCEIVSGGSTPSAYQSHFISRQTEIRPGTYVFNDANTLRGDHCSLEECAARVIATVVSDAVPGQVVIDAGSKTLASDRNGPDPNAGFGYIVEYPEARITKLSEEHGQVDVRECDRRPAVGDRVTVIPNHICPCINLRDYVWWLDGDGALRKVGIDARGRIE